MSTPSASVQAVADALNRHERTIRKYIRYLREDLGHPDFLAQLEGRPITARQQSVLAQLKAYRAEKKSKAQIRDLLMGDCSPRLTLNEACAWLTPRISKPLLAQFKAHFTP